MKLKEAIRERIGNKQTKEAKAIRYALSLDLDFTEFWLGKCIEANKENGPLTTEKALRRLEKELGVDRSEILEEDEPVAVHDVERA